MADIRRFLAEAKRQPRGTTIEGAWFDRERDAIVATLSTGVTLAVRRSAVRPIDKVPAEALADVAVEGPRYSVWSKNADIGLQIETIEEYGVPIDSLPLPEAQGR
ncbi:MAG: hypothetical protein JOZ24_13080 [Candidatus Eremiobacteraeota bacterium]|nr:hypothetical protein [Candidatus Eremiobacteraeota bacterium]